MGIRLRCITMFIIKFIKEYFILAEVVIDLGKKYSYFETYKAVTIKDNSFCLKLKAWFDYS